MVQVTKFDGRREEFDREKIVRTCLRVGVSREGALKIAESIEKSAFDGISTSEIYSSVKKELSRFEKTTAMVYGLREAVSSMDPKIFEIYVKKLLEASGYKCEYDRIIPGLCVEHQVDVIATKGTEHLVECKRHHNPHRFCGLGVCLQVQARLEDIMDGYRSGANKENFSRAWIITNTKFSDHAKKYANAKKIKLTGWKYPDKESFEILADSARAYPVTMLKAKKETIDRLISSGIITIHDMSGDSLSHAGIERSIASRLLSQKSAILKQANP